MYCFWLVMRLMIGCGVGLGTPVFSRLVAWRARGVSFTPQSDAYHSGEELRLIRLKFWKLGWILGFSLVSGCGKGVR
jgi:hypothetical protein